MADSKRSATDDAEAARQALGDYMRTRSWPARLIKSTERAIRLPADVASGTTVVMDPTTGHTNVDVIDDSARLGGLAAGFGGLMPRKSGGTVPYSLKRGGSAKIIAPEHSGPMAEEARTKLENAGYQFTKSGIAAFQRDHDLNTSGVVDPATMGALKGIAAHIQSKPGMARGGRAHIPSPVRAGPGLAGFIHSDVAGRTDRLPTAVRPNSHVIPADVVSGIGQGNSSAGAKLIQKILHPHSMKLMVGNPRANRIPNIFAKKADGGSSGDVPIVVAGGEYIVDPETVASIGGGNPQKGHDILDKFITGTRKQIIDTMKRLPGPKS